MKEEIVIFFKKYAKVQFIAALQELFFNAPRITTQKLMKIREIRM